MNKIYLSAFRLFALITVCIFSFINSYSQWTQTNGPLGISVLSFFDTGSWLFAGTDSKGAYRSPDHGQTWSAANINISNLEVFSFAQDSSYLYAGTNTGVFRSTDNGLTWEQANNGIISDFANCLVVADGFLFMGTVGAGVFRSADHGDSWTDANGGTLNSAYITAICYAGGKLIAEDDNILFYSTDDGDSWLFDSYGPEQYWYISDFYTSGDTVMAAAGNVVFTSFDAINSWNGPITVDPSYIGITGIARTGNTFYVGCDQGVFSSTDFGSSWSPIVPTGLRLNIKPTGGRSQFDFIRSGNNFLLSYEEIGIYKSPDGITWDEAKTGFPPASTIDNCMITAGNDVWSGTHTDGVYVTSDGGATWNHSGAANIATDTFPNSIIKSMLYAGNNILLAGGCGSGNGLWRSADYGATWTHITAGFNQNFGNFQCITSLAKSGNNLLAAASTNGMYYSTDNGLTWQSSSVINSDYYVDAIAVHDNVVCIGVSPLNLYANTGIYRSTDNGVTFTFTDGTVTDASAMDADTLGDFYAGSLSDVYRSTDDGITWNLAETGIPFQAGGFAVKTLGQKVFVGNSDGVFYSDDFGASYSPASVGLDGPPNNSVQGFTVHDDTLFAGLFRDAIWKRALSEFGIATAVNQVPSPEKNDFKIISSSSHNITYQIQLANASDATLQLIDVMGRTIESVSLGNLSGGIHSGSFYTKNISSGIYFLKMTAGNFMKTEKWEAVQ